jgi:uncharacterized membrane protein YeaQ/YmgE (transglycosylase-associated protein family)
MDIIILLLVGLVAGVLASKVVRGSGFGLLGDIVLGIIGAFVGGWAFRHFGWHAPFAGMAGAIAVAFIGAVVVLLVVRVIMSASRRRM